MKKLILFISLLALVFLVGCSHTKSITKTDISLTAEEQEQGIKVAPDGTKYIVDPKKIQGGGPGKGGIGTDSGIPALAEKNIKFVSVEEADKWIEDNELVLALIYKNEKRVYPLQVLVWHEIANDVIAGDPVLVTYCPLCGSGIAYERKIEINGKKVATRFGTSGKLYNSNLVMYDETTDTYWQQIDGKAIVGELTGQELKEISIDTVSWRDWKAAHPDSQVLSQNTGMKRSYGRDPYGNYYEDSFLIFPVENQDSRIHPKTQVVGIEVNGKHKAYIRDEIKKGESIQDSVAGVNIKVKKLDDSRIIITNLDTGKEIIKEEDMWFAWYAFHPETELYKK